MTNIGQIHIKNALCEIVRFDENDFLQIKHFVLELCKELDNPTYFITDDIDSELPLLLKEKYGLVYGVVCENEIIAIQAIDYDKNKTLNFDKLLNIKQSIMEVGWAMVAPSFRKQNISIHLSKLLEQAAYKETGNENLVATVHPKNISSVLLFLRLGYIGIKFKVHYDVIRLIMIKNINLKYKVDDSTIPIEIKCSEYEQQEHLLNNGYICFDMVIKQNIELLRFIKSDFNKNLFR